MENGKFLGMEGNNPNVEFGTFLTEEQMELYKQQLENNNRAIVKEILEKAGVDKKLIEDSKTFEELYNIISNIKEKQNISIIGTQEAKDKILDDFLNGKYVQEDGSIMIQKQLEGDIPKESYTFLKTTEDGKTAKSEYQLNAKEEKISYKNIGTSFNGYYKTPEAQKILKEGLLKEFGVNENILQDPTKTKRLVGVIDSLINEQGVEYLTREKMNFYKGKLAEKIEISENGDVTSKNGNFTINKPSKEEVIKKESLRQSGIGESYLAYDESYKELESVLDGMSAEGKTINSESIKSKINVEEKTDRPMSIGDLKREYYEGKKVEQEKEKISDTNKEYYETVSPQKEQTEKSMSIGDLKREYYEGKQQEQAEKQQAKTITIEKGDTLSELALKYNTTVEELAELNGIKNPDLIYAGNKLEIPVPSKEHALSQLESLKETISNMGITTTDVSKAFETIENTLENSREEEQISK